MLRPGARAKAAVCVSYALSVARHFLAPASGTCVHAFLRRTYPDHWVFVPPTSLNNANCFTTSCHWFCAPSRRASSRCLLLLLILGVVWVFTSADCVAVAPCSFDCCSPNSDGIGHFSFFLAVWISFVLCDLVFYSFSYWFIPSRYESFASCMC